MIKSLTVYCGANLGSDKRIVKAADTFGKKMAENGISLVYGGGRFGIMGTIARAVLNNGGQVHGVITSELRDRGAAFEDITSLDVVANMDIRKKKMMDMSDGMVALPGGIGTLEEISEAASWTTIGDNSKPAAFYNFEGFYDPLRNMFRRMYYKGFFEKTYLDSICFANNFDQLIDFMNNYQAPAYRRYR